MIIPLSQQVNLVLYSFLAGILTGLLFDIYRIIRGFNNPNKFFTFIEDTLFWTFSAIIIFMFLLYTNYAYVGIYVYMWIFVGIFIYLRFVSKHFLKVQHIIIGAIVRFMRISGKIISFPFNFIVYVIKQKMKESKKIT